MLRVEDLPLLTGAGRFAADIRLDRETHMRVVRSPVPHGIVHAIDVSAARSVPGVVAVWPGSAIDLGPIEFRQVGFPQMLPYRQPVLARTRVRYVGEPVAIVVAADPYVAEDAADAVQLDVESLGPVLRPSPTPAAFDSAHHTAAPVF